MNNMKLVFFLAFTGLGLTACSQTPTSTPDEPDTVAKALELEQAKPQPAIPQALPLQQAQIARIPHYNQPPAMVQLPHYPLPSAPVYPAQQQRPRIIPAVVSQPSQRGPNLSHNELQAIGHQIFVNEGGGNPLRLVHWNDGEDFASMGIGHFTWYPSGRTQRFGSTFPGLLSYMEQEGVQLSPWLQQAKQTGAPWRSRSELLNARSSSRVQELIRLLNSTKHLQAKYIVERAQRAMPNLVKASSGNMQPRVAQNLNAVANTPGGWYALIDYVNFKGEGLSNRGGYRGQNWGLRQVLEEMQPSAPGRQALHEFSDAAFRVLQRRVQNSDPSRNEARWLRGWKNRVDTYRNPIV